MFNYNIIDGITNIDSELIEKYLQYKKAYQRKQKKKLKCILSAVAVCLILSICIPTLIIYTPVEYDIDYYTTPYERAWKVRNIWLYYTDNTDLNRERVRLPCYYHNVFITWKHINGIGEEVRLLDYQYQLINSETVSDSKKEYDFHFQNNKPAKKNYVLWLTISGDIRTYFDQYDQYTLMLSLVRSMTEHHKIVYRDIYVIIE